MLVPFYGCCFQGQAEPPLRRRRIHRDRDGEGQYRGTSLIRNSALLGPYSRDYA